MTVNTSARTLIVVGHDFGWGSAGKLAAIIAVLRRRITDLRVVLVGTSLGRSIIGDDLIDHWYDMDSGDPTLPGLVARLQAEVAVVVLDPDWARALQDAGCAVVYVDSIPYIWTDADDLPTDVSAYCAQATPILPETCRAPLARIERLSWVGPIITPPRPAARRPGYVVVNFGGLHSPSNVGGNDRYLQLVLPPVLAALADAGFETVSVCGNVQPDDVAGLVPDSSPRVRVQRLAHDAFLDELSSASLLVTSPGLTTLLEAGHASTPTICLPPQNLSQFYNGDRFEACIGAGPRIQWPDDILSRPELERIRVGGESAALDMINASLTDADEAFAHRWLRSEISTAIQQLGRVPRWDALVNGGTEGSRAPSGADQIADLVVAELSTAASVPAAR